jgi:hypothetical protein
MENVMTLYGHDDPADYADLVEYAYGNSKTHWGGIRWVHACSSG